MNNDQLILLLKEAIMHLKNLNLYPWADFPDVTAAEDFVTSTEKLLNDQT